MRVVSLNWEPSYFKTQRQHDCVLQAWKAESSVLRRLLSSLFWTGGVQCRDAAVDVNLTGIELNDAMQHFQFSCSVRFSCCHGNKAPFFTSMSPVHFSLRARWPDSFPCCLCNICVRQRVRAPLWLTASLRNPSAASPRLPPLCIPNDIPSTYSDPDESKNPTRLHLGSYALTCCEQAGGSGAKWASAEQRGTERRRGKLRSGAELSCASTQKFRWGQARTLAALRLPTVYWIDAGERTKCTNSSLWNSELSF